MQFSFLHSVTEYSPAANIAYMRPAYSVLKPDTTIAVELGLPPLLTVEGPGEGDQH